MQPKQSDDSINVRQGQLAELETLAQMQVAMAAETEPFRLDIAVVREGVRAVFLDSSKGTYWVAESPSGEVLGMLLTVPEWSDWRNGTVLWIHSVYTAPTARGQGVYRALYQHLQNEVQTHESLRGIRLYVEKSNRRAQSVYQKLGMSNEHYDMYEWMKNF